MFDQANNNYLQNLAKTIIIANKVSFSMSMEDLMLLIMKYHRSGINVLNIRNEWLFNKDTISTLNKDFEVEKYSNEYQLIIHKIYGLEKKYNHPDIEELLQDLKIRMSSDLCDSLMTLQYKPYFKIDIQDLTVYEYFAVVSNFNDVVKSIRQKQNEEVGG